MPEKERTPRPRTDAKKLATDRRGSRSTGILEAAQLSVGHFIRTAREAMDLTQAQVAKLSRETPWQLSRAAVSAIERGQNFPGLEAMLALSNVLHIDPKEIIERARLTAVAAPTEELEPQELEARALEYFRAGDFKQAIAAYDAMLERVSAESPDRKDEEVERIARIEIRRSTALKRAGALLSAISSAERAVVLARQRPDVQAEAYVVLADLQVQRGNLSMAQDAARRAVELAEASGRPAVVAWAWMVEAAGLYLAGEPVASRRAFERARGFAKKGRDTAHITHIEGNIGQCWLAQGELGEARSSLERAVTLARKSKQPHLEASFTVELGKIAFLEERLDAATRLAQGALRIAAPRDHRLTIFRAEWLLHKIQGRIKPQDPDRTRLNRLKGMFRDVDQHEGVEEIREYRTCVVQGMGQGDERK